MIEEVKQCMKIKVMKMINSNYFKKRDQKHKTKIAFLQ